MRLAESGALLRLFRIPLRYIQATPDKLRFVDWVIAKTTIFQAQPSFQPVTHQRGQTPARRE